MNKLLWGVIAIIGASCFGYLALQQGETVSAMYLVVAAVCIYMIAYRFYGRFVAYKVLELDKNRATPAMINDDGRDQIGDLRAIQGLIHIRAAGGDVLDEEGRQHRAQRIQSP